jgi:type II secretory pathway pseudopilin PulG
MDTGLRRLLHAGAGRSTQRGTSLLELTLAMGISGILSVVGLSQWDTGHIELAAAQHELTESLDQAFILARARGVNVTVGLGSGKDANHLPIRLGRKVHWGKPARIPLPPGMADPVRAGATGEAHATITVTPRHTATASLWFLNDGEEALCMRLSNRGHVRMLRWRPAARRWVRV